MAFMDFLNKGSDIVSKGTSILGGIAEGIGSIGKLFSKDWWRGQTGSGLTSAQIEQNEFNAEQAALARDFNAEQAEIQRDWQTQMDNTKVQRSVQDMQAAGVNPAMMMGGTGVSASTPSGASASGPAASAAGPGSAGDGRLANLLELGFAQERFKLMEAQIRDFNASAKKKEADAGVSSQQEESIRIENQYKEEFLQLRNEGQRAANDCTREQLGEIRANIREIDARISNLNAATATEESKQVYNYAMAAKANIDAYIAVEMLPYEQAYKSAAATAQRGQAAFAFCQAAWQQGLIDRGVLDHMAKSYAAEAGIKESDQLRAEFETAVKTGDPDGKVYDGPIAGFIGRVAAGIGALIDATNVGQIVHFGMNKSTSSSTSHTTSSSTSVSEVHTYKEK